MNGFKIFAKAIELVLNNGKAAAQIALVPMLLMILVTVGAAHSLRGTSGGAVAFGPGVFLAAVVGVFSWLWVAVAWHRFILLSEYPSGWVPAIKPSKIGSYFAHSLLIALALAVILVPLVLVVGIIFSASSVLTLLVSFIFYMMGTLLFYRLSPILPAAAIGKPPSVSGAWNATRGRVDTFVGLIVAGVVFGIIVGLLSSIVTRLPMIGGILDLLVQVIAILIGVSVLSTIYGVFVEERSLD